MKLDQSQIRQCIAEEAARLMYEEDVREYYRAKQIAAKRILGRPNRRSRHNVLPTNAEIQESLLRHAKLAEGDERLKRLAIMRLIAMDFMSFIEAFSPRLIGSVSTGHIRHGSDIDIHVFAQDPERLRIRLDSLKRSYSENHVSICKSGHYQEYLHFHLQRQLSDDPEHFILIELTLYPTIDLRHTPRSSTDGRPIHRLKRCDVQLLLRHEHPEEYQDYRSIGLDAMLHNTPQPSSPAAPYQSLVTC